MAERRFTRVPIAIGDDMMAAITGYLFRYYNRLSPLNVTLRAYLHVNAYVYVKTGIELLLFFLNEKHETAI